MPANIDLGDNYSLDEDGSDLIIRHDPSGSELRFDDADELFEFASQARFTEALTDSNGRTIYDVSTGTVGDGTTNADHESVNTEQTNHTPASGSPYQTVDKGSVFRRAGSDSVSVGTSATTIRSQNNEEARSAEITVVQGTSASDQTFIDLVQWAPFGSNPTTTKFGRAFAPDRSYGIGTYNLTLSVSSGTFDVVTDTIQLSSYEA